MSSSSDESERDFSGLVLRCEWRRIREAYEFFDYNHRPYSGDRRGYIVEPLVFLHDNKASCCDDSKGPYPRPAKTVIIVEEYNSESLFIFFFSKQCWFRVASSF